MKDSQLNNSRIKKRALRLLNSEILIILVIVLSIGLAAAAQIGLEANATWLTVSSLFFGMIAAIIIAHKIRRIALAVRDLRTGIDALAGMQRRLGAPQVSRFDAVQHSAQDSSKNSGGSQIHANGQKHDLAIGRSVESLALRVNQLAASTACQAHSELSALTGNVLEERLAAVRPRSITTAGGQVCNNLAAWMIGSRHDEIEHYMFNPRDRDLELALIDVMIADFTNESPYGPNEYNVMGHLLPGSEIWIIGGSRNRQKFSELVWKNEPSIEMIVLGQESRELNILRKVTS